MEVKQPPRHMEAALTVTHHQEPVINFNKVLHTVEGLSNNLQQDTGKNVQLTYVDQGNTGEKDLPELLAELGKSNVLTMLIEGGGIILGQAFRGKLVKEVYW